MPHKNGTRVCNHKQLECIEDSVTYWYLNVRKIVSFVLSSAQVFCSLFQELAQEVKKTTNEKHQFMDDMDAINSEDAARNISVDFYDDDPLAQSNSIDFDEDIENSSEHGMDEYADSGDSAGTYQSCNCLPSCTSIHYDAEISQSALNLMQYFKANNIFDDKDDE